MIMDPNFIVKVLLSLIVAAALAFAVTPLVKRLAQRVGAMDVPKDERRMDDAAQIEILPEVGA